MFHAACSRSPSPGWLWLRLLAAAPLLLAGCRESPAPTATPKEAATAHFKAVMSGDIEAARATSVGDARSRRWLDAQVEEVAALRSYHDAMKARFGDNLPGMTGLSASARDAQEAKLLAALENGREKIDGDTATISAGDRVVDLKKVNGHWKVDRGRLGEQESVDSFVSRTRRTAKAYREVAAEVQQGKYKAPAEAQQAFGDRLVKAIEAVRPPGP